MKASIASLVLAGLVSTAAAAQFGAAELKAESAPKAVAMSTLKQRKEIQHAQDRARGLFNKGRYPSTNNAVACVDGKAGEYACNGLDLTGFISHEDTGSETREGNDIWGWTAPNGREFALLGQTDGTAFVEVNKDGSLTYVGRLPTQTEVSLWRDIKVIGNFAYIGSEAPGHGLQVFDLRKLLRGNLRRRPRTFSVTRDLTALFTGFGSSHNIVANEERNLIAAVGTQRSLKCRGGPWFVDVSNPRRPRDAGCDAADGYTHDSQMVIYNGPDARYQGRLLTFNYNEDTLTIDDIEDLSAPSEISRTTYNGATYTHQGWLTPDHKYVLLDDELDEIEQNGAAADQRTTTYVVDVTDLENPVFKGVYKSPVRSIDHNQYIIDDLSYQANYGSGLRVVNVSSIAADSTGGSFEEKAFFDVYPEDDAQGGAATFNGAWSVYPYFQSGHIVISSIERGLFSVKLQD